MVAGLALVILAACGGDEPTAAALAAGSMFDERLQSAYAEARDNDELKLADLTDFDWTSVGSFGPFTGPDEVEAALGDLEFVPERFRALFTVVCWSLSWETVS